MYTCDLYDKVTYGRIILSKMLEQYNVLATAGNHENRTYLTNIIVNMEWMDGLTNEWMGGWMSGWIGVWMYGWID